VEIMNYDEYLQEVQKDGLTIMLGAGMILKKGI